MAATKLPTQQSIDQLCGNGASGKRYIEEEPQTKAEKETSLREFQYFDTIDRVLNEITNRFQENSGMLTPITEINNINNNDNFDRNALEPSTVSND